MEPPDLPRKPLVEAVFEFRWALTAEGSRPQVDPSYKLLVGALFAQVRNRYPQHEELPTAAVPDEMIPYVIQHRFKDASGYPLLQVGPGLFAVNETDQYSWSRFKPTVLEALGELTKSYTGKLTPAGALLRYINAVPFDPSTIDKLAFIRTQLNLAIQLPERLFADLPVEGRPTSVGMQATYPVTDPPGSISLKVADAVVADRQSVAWEIVVQSDQGHAPAIDEMESWLDRAHKLARSWFFAVIHGSLEEEFRRLT